MASRLAALMAKFHTKPRPIPPAWATEDTVEMKALAKANCQIEWATESTGLLNALRAGLESLDGTAGRSSGH